MSFPDASGEVSMCEMKPRTGTFSIPFVAGSQPMTYPFSSIEASQSPKRFISSTRCAPRTFCPAVLGTVSECSSDLVSNET